MVVFGFIIMQIILCCVAAVCFALTYLNFFAGKLCDQEVEATFQPPGTELRRGKVFGYESDGKSYEVMAWNSNHYSYEPGERYIVYVSSRWPRLLVTSKKASAGNVLAGVFMLAGGIVCLVCMFVI